MSIRAIDDEVSFRRSDIQRVSLGEITNINTTPTKQRQESSAKPASLAWNEDGGFPPALDDVPEGQKAVTASESPLFKKTPQGERKPMSREVKAAAVPGFSEEDSEDDNDDTVAIEINLNLSNTSDVSLNNDSCMSHEVMLKLPSFNTPKYSEADMQKARQEWQQDAKNLEEAVSIADKLLSRAMAAEEARNSLQAELKQATKDVQAAKEELLREKEDKSISNTQTRALSHTLRALEQEMKSTKDAHAAELDRKEKECQGLIKEAKKVWEAEKTQFTKEKLAALYSATEQTAKLQLELKQQQETADAAIVEAKQKVYAKVKAQFDNGNKEFNRIKGEKEAVCEELERCQQLHQEERGKRQAEEARSSALQGTLLQLADELSNVLKEVLPVAQYSRAAKLLNATEVVRCSAADLEAARTLCEQAKCRVNQRAQELSALQESAQAVSLEVTAVKDALEEKEAALRDTLRKCSQLAEEQTRALSAHEVLQKELNAVHKEKESQMLAVAKLATSNTTLEIQVETMQGEMSELSARNDGLRKMNEEMMGMLEQAHGV